MQEILAYEFGMTQSTAYAWIHRLSGVLHHALEAGGHLPAREPAQGASGLADDVVTEIAWGLHNVRACYKQSETLGVR